MEWCKHQLHHVGDGLMDWLMDLMNEGGRKGMKGKQMYTREMLISLLMFIENFRLFVSIFFNLLDHPLHVAHREHQLIHPEYSFVVEKRN